MKETIIQTVLDGMRAVLTENQLELLTDVTRKALSECEITPKATEEEQRNKENLEKMPHWYPYAITLNITRGSVTDFLPLEEYAAYSFL